LAKANYDGGSLFDGFIPNYDNDTNPLAKTGYDDVGSFAAPIVNLELLLETIPKVDAKPEAKKNNTTIVPTVKRFSASCFHRLSAVFINL
jgi:hypothetical protein